MTSWLLAQAHRRSHIGETFRELADDVERASGGLSALLTKEKAEAAMLVLSLRRRSWRLAELAQRWLNLARWVSPHDLSAEPGPPEKRPRHRERVH